MRPTTQIDEAHDYVRDEGAPKAASLRVKLLAAIKSLEDYPEQGRPISRRVRELTVVPPYIIRYRVGRDAVTILRIRHAARRPD